MAAVDPGNTGGYVYDYVTLDVPYTPGASSTPSVDASAASGGDTSTKEIGVFGAQLGWRASHVAVLYRSTETSADREEVMRDLQTKGTNVTRDRLMPTIRPRDAAALPAGGVYVHRWFEVVTNSVAEFVALSNEGWQDFETRYETEVYGLFTAERNAGDRLNDVTRLFLLTWYKDHNEWEVSRNPSAAAWDSFVRRQMLTKGTWAASTILIAPR